MRLAVVIAFVVTVPVMVVPVVIPAAIVLTLADFPFANTAVVFLRTKIPFTIGGPGMFTVYTAVFSIPIAGEESLSVVMWYDPASAGIGCPTPISVMPFVMVPHRIPVAL